jgi:hypothetical protein
MRIAHSFLKFIQKGVSMWQNWIIGSLGLWLIIASFTLRGNLINELIVGIAVAVFGFWTAVRSQLKEGLK